MFVGIDVSKLKFDACCLFDGKKELGFSVTIMKALRHCWNGQKV
jgi:hypothetical protein